MSSEAEAKIFPAFLGQLLGLVATAVLFWLHTGGDFTGLGAPVDISYLLVPLAWLAAVLVLILWLPRRPERALTGLLVGAVPACLGLAAATVLAADVPAGAGPLTTCDFGVVTAFWSERLVFAGLAGSGSLWLGLLVTLGITSGSRERSATWPLVIAAALLVGSIAWALLDPIMPSRSAVGGPAVRGLWVLAFAAGALWVWTGRFGDLRAAGLAAVAVASLGVLAIGVAMVACHRAATLYELAYGTLPDPFGGRHTAGLVVATCLGSVAPALAATAAATWVVHLIRARGRDRMRLAAGAGVIAALVAVGIGRETGWRGRYEAGCVAPLFAELVLPKAGHVDLPRPGPMLVIGTGAARLGADALSERRPVLTRTMPSVRTLGVAADHRVALGRLQRFLRAAGAAGIVEFRLLARAAGEPRRCAREARLYGVCLSRHHAMLRGLPFAINRLDRTTGAPPGVVANVIVQPGRMEVTFGGFGVEATELNAMARTLDDRHGVRDLAGLVEVLTEAHGRFPQSRTLLLLPHDDLSVGELAAILDRMRGPGPGYPFPDVVVSPLVR